MVAKGNNFLTRRICYPVTAKTYFRLLSKIACYHSFDRVEKAAQLVWHEIGDPRDFVH